MKHHLRNTVFTLRTFYWRLKKHIKLYWNFYTVSSTQPPNKTLTSKPLHAYKIATILDDFSFQVFQPEAILKQLHAQHWEKEMDHFNADLLLVESAWLGAKESWKSKINNNHKELRELLAYCNRYSIITIFWNKEDPTHFMDFINTAIYFDFIFTTDIHTIPKYKKFARHPNVFLLPFACQPSMHNPVETMQRKDAISFAGAYYPQFKERNKILQNFLTQFSHSFEIDIYDRHYHSPDTKFKYPKLFHPYIRGGLPYSQLDLAYKGYKYAINLSTVTSSKSMFARRIFELIASNTLVISNYSKGIKLLFEDLIICTDNEIKAYEQLLYYKKNPVYGRKIRLLALRKVMMEHTARQRLESIVSKINVHLDHSSEKEKVLVVSIANSVTELAQIRNSFNVQSYVEKELFVWCSFVFQMPNEKNIQYQSLTVDASSQFNTLINAYSGYLSLLSPKDYYAENYLTDLMLANQYGTYAVIGKKAYYRMHSEDTIRLTNAGMAYKKVSSMAAVRSIIHTNQWTNQNIDIVFPDMLKIEYKHTNILSIDEFNYCQDGLKFNMTNRDKDIVSDLKNVNRGIHIHEL